MDISFYFRIDAAAGLAHDTETGENIATTSRVTLEDVKQTVDDEKYAEIQQTARAVIADKFDQPIEYIVPITEEEWLESQGDDEDEDLDYEEFQR